MARNGEIHDWPDDSGLWTLHHACHYHHPWTGGKSSEALLSNAESDPWVSDWGSDVADVRDHDSGLDTRREDSKRAAASLISSLARIGVVTDTLNLAEVCERVSFERERIGALDKSKGDDGVSGADSEWRSRMRGWDVSVEAMFCFNSTGLLFYSIMQRNEAMSAVIWEYMHQKDLVLPFELSI